MTTSTPTQLALLDDSPSAAQPPVRRRADTAWRLDRATRARGLRGVGAARKALADAAARLEARSAA
jgi:hypothetical protein